MINKKYVLSGLFSISALFGAAGDQPAPVKEGHSPLRLEDCLERHVIRVSGQQQHYLPIAQYVVRTSNGTPRFALPGGYDFGEEVPEHKVFAGVIGMVSSPDKSFTERLKAEIERVVVGYRMPDYKIIDKRELWAACAAVCKKTLLRRGCGYNGTLEIERGVLLEGDIDQLSFASKSRLRLFSFAQREGEGSFHLEPALPDCFYIRLEDQGVEHEVVKSTRLRQDECLKSLLAIQMNNNLIVLPPEEPMLITEGGFGIPLSEKVAAIIEKAHKSCEGEAETHEAPLYVLNAALFATFLKQQE